ncbi:MULTISPECIES: tyrosine-type recombinase/integrase [Pseudobutyrivibrio]|uniref:Site-specific recombinase XerD n=1 Tax=Pseudobutyrivibrio xylanivorans TaxID=185007 RepID=A0A1G5RXZ2_PSEXY|nr:MULTISPECIES: tyrosine-type recombinase/integrase [Pseudobutyrivibrio]MDC7278355.1 tyrosine-type recombinase/integrase [Butyrivibrio fibrisolvens]SCZ78189.1 Site-specific recombinase XerD [Pseudobutyrivibrio xylanivorans]
MGKDSSFYKDKNKNLKLKLRELEDQLPKPALDYVHSKEQNAQTSTLISYCYDLLTFFRFLSDSNPIVGNDLKKIDYDILNKITPDDIEEYKRYLELNTVGEQHENGKKAIARKLSPLRGMYKYLMVREYVKSDPTQLVELPKIKKDKNIVRMNNYEVQAILEAIDNGNAFTSERQRKYNQKTRGRDLAILTLMLNTGIRVSECNGLDLNDVDFNVNSLTIVRKGGGQDIIYFNDEVSQVLQDYVNGEREYINPVEGQETALFYSLQGRRISVDAIENLVKKYAKMVVPNKKITPHKLRSTYGTALYRETGDIRLVADVLGHENINTTIDYYAAIEDEHKRLARNAVDFSRKDN